MYLLKAQINDMDLLYKWANDEVVRNNSFNCKKISYLEHKKWFEEKLKTDNSDIYIYYFKDEPVGQIRLDYQDDMALIDFSIDKARRGKGHGTRILDLIESADKKKIFNNYVGRVKYNNIASQRGFEKMGYKRSDKETYIEYNKCSYQRII